MKINTTKISKEFLDLLENLKPEQWNLKVNKNWTIKDVVAHLIGWEKECAEQLPVAWKTKNRPWFLLANDFDKFNKKSVNYYKNYTPKKLIKELNYWQNKVDKEINKIGEANLKKQSGLFNWIFDEGHYLIHLNQIKKF